MNRYIFIIMAALLTGLGGCTKTDAGDTDFIHTGGTPSKTNALFEITQDNSGNVTITPYGEGAAYYRVYLGTDANSYTKVNAGSSLTHKYTEGTYTVKVVSVGLNGATAEASKPLTVTFRQPEALTVSIEKSPTNNLIYNVSATAQYETFFQVYFGDVADETPRSFNEGDMVYHQYSNTGTYTIRVVALSGGVAKTTYTEQITITDPLLLPVTFESPTLPYNFSNFSGGVGSVVDNPAIGGINTSTKVGRMIKYAGDPWGGTVLPLSGNMDFSANKIFAMKVFSPRAGAKVLLKVENATDNTINFEKEVTTTTANAWEELYFDYSAINATNAYSKIILIFDNGTTGDGSSNFTFYFDDIRLINAIPAYVGLPLNFEASHDYGISNFDGGELTIINNPQKSGINTSNRVAQMIKKPGQTWGGSVIMMTDPINFSKKTFKAKIFSPRVGARVLLKVEAIGNSNFYEKEMLTTVANAWEEITFDYSGINAANSYQKLVFIFDNGTAGDGSSNFTFLIDDITLN